MKRLMRRMIKEDTAAEEREGVSKEKTYQKRKEKKEKKNQHWLHLQAECLIIWICQSLVRYHHLSLKSLWRSLVKAFRGAFKTTINGRY